MMSGQQQQQHIMGFDEARVLLTEPYACLKLTTANKHVALLPKFIGSFGAGIKEQLNSELRFYSQQLDGVLVSYSNVRRVENHGAIMEHFPHLHMDVRADFIIFQPSVGAILKGVINKQGKDHIGVLVHRCFNGSLSKPVLPNGEFLPAENVTLGSTVLFTVKKIYTANGIVSFNGELTQDSLNELTTTNKSLKRPVPDCLDDSTASDATTAPKKKKRKKDKSEDVDKSHGEKSKKSSVDSVMEISVNLSTADDTQDDTVDSGKGKDKKKKKKRKRESSPRIAPDTPVNGGSGLRGVVTSTPMVPMLNLHVDGSSKNKSKHNRKGSHVPAMGSLDLSVIGDTEKDNGSVGSLDSGLGFGGGGHGELSDLDSRKQKKKRKKDKSRLSGGHSSVFDDLASGSKVEGDISVITVNDSSAAEGDASKMNGSDIKSAAKKKKKHKKQKVAKVV